MNTRQPQQPDRDYLDYSSRYERSPRTSRAGMLHARYSDGEPYGDAPGSDPYSDFDERTYDSEPYAEGPRGAQPLGTRPSAPKGGGRGPLIAVVIILLLILAGVIFGVSRLMFSNKGEAPTGGATLEVTNDAVGQPEPTSITVTAVGDMIFARNVWNLIDAEGGTAPLANVSDVLASTDVTIGNLESCLSATGDPDTGKDVILQGHPDGIESLVASDFTFVSMANNHTLDYGVEALENTINALNGAGILHAGAGMNSTEAWTEAVAGVEGKTICFLSFSDILPAGFVAGENSPGIAPSRTDMEAVCNKISECKAQYDYVFVSFHWGVEYEDYITDQQRDEAHAAVDAGADALFCEHPHVIQGVEFYNGAIIAYSLGDFVFDHYSRKTGESFILQLELTDNGIENVVAIPTYLNESGAPSVVTGDEAAAILDRLTEISEGMNVTITQQDDKGYITANA